MLCTEAAIARTEINPATFFIPGQLWRYHTRPNEEASRLVIGSVDVVRRQTVISICVTGAHIINLRRPDGFQDMLPHIPIAAATLATCVVEMCGETPVPLEFDEGYQMWREGVEWGQSSFFTIPVADILNLAEQSAPK